MTMTTCAEQAPTTPAKATTFATAHRDWLLVLAKKADIECSPSRAIGDGAAQAAFERAVEEADDAFENAVRAIVTAPAERRDHVATKLEVLERVATGEENEGGELRDLCTLLIASLKADVSRMPRGVCSDSACEE